MLKGLDDVQWLGSAYPSNDYLLANLIRGLCSDDSHERMACLARLDSLLYHQGSIFESSVQVVPFLIELLSIESVADKHGILSLVNTIVSAGNNKRDLNERAIAKAREGSGVFTQLLDHENPLVRIRALYVLSDCIDNEQTLLNLVRRFIEKESVPEIVTRALHRLVYLIHKSEETLEFDSTWIEFLQGVLTKRISPFIKVAAIEVLIEIYGEATPPPLLAELRTHVQICQQISPHGLYHWLKYALNKLQLSACVDLLIQMLDESSDDYHSIMEILGLLFGFTFDWYGSRLKPGHLTPEQLKALLTLAHMYDWWTTEGQTSILVSREDSFMTTYGLPIYWREFMKFIETRGASTKTDQAPTEIKDYYGLELAEHLAFKIREHHPIFYQMLVANIVARVGPLEADERVQVFAEEMQAALPTDYPAALEILLKVFDHTPLDDNPLFQQGHWVRPIVRFIEHFGAAFPDLSAQALAKISAAQ